MCSYIDWRNIFINLEFPIVLIYWNWIRTEKLDLKIWWKYKHWVAAQDNADKLKLCLQFTNKAVKTHY